MDHDAHFHERSVDLSTACVDDVDVVLANRLYDADMGFSDSTFCHLGTAEWDTESKIRECKRELRAKELVHG